MINLCRFAVKKCVRFFFVRAYMCVCMCVHMQESGQSWLLNILHGYGCDRI